MSVSAFVIRLLGDCDWLLPDTVLGWKVTLRVPAAALFREGEALRLERNADFAAKFGGPMP